MNFTEDTFTALQTLSEDESSKVKPKAIKYAGPRGQSNSSQVSDHGVDPVSEAHASLQCANNEASDRIAHFIMSCQHCSFTSSSTKNFHSHVRLHFQGNHYSCHTCSYITPKLSNLKTHELLHTGERPFRCNLCTSTFTQHAHVHSHMMTKHRAEVTSGFPCTHCGKQLLNN